jgi:3-dehydroquinate synthase
MMLDRLSHQLDDIRPQSFTIAYEYPVVFTRDAFNPANRHLVDVVTRREPDKRHRCALFVDAGVMRAIPDFSGRAATFASVHAGQIELAATASVPGGEVCKNDPAVVPRLLDMMSQFAIDRHSFVIAVGGGAVLDAVGYAAAIFHRGVRHIRFPTTVLSQDDSGVGVKNAVNWRDVKNLTGTFAPPWAVINDSAFLDTLPPREKRAGMAEAVKVALIRDRAFFCWLEESAAALAGFSPAHLDVLIKRSAELHMRQIRLGGDPFETGSARPLDFGHWSAHKLEQLTQHAVNHGEAVAIGIALDTRYSVAAGLLAERDGDRACRLLRRLGFSLWNDRLKRRDDRGRLALLQGLADFREHLGGELTITLLGSIGRGVEVHEMDEVLIGRCIDWLEQHA